MLSDKNIIQDNNWNQIFTWSKNTVGERQSLLFSLVVVIQTYVCLSRDGFNWQNKGISHMANLLAAITDAYNDPNKKRKERERERHLQIRPKSKMTQTGSSDSANGVVILTLWQSLQAALPSWCFSSFSVLVTSTSFLPCDSASFVEVLTRLTETLPFFF